MFVGRKRKKSAKRKRRRRRRREKNNRSELAESCFPNVILPEAMVVEILSRLSFRPLVGFTLVSKQWRSLISDICATKPGSPTVLLGYESRAHSHSWIGYSFSPHSINRHNHAYVKRVYVPWAVREYTYIRRFKILGSCNGLLLMCIEDDVFLWNPLTKFFKKVLAYFRLGDEGYGVCSGLCYDSTSDEYKAVLALSHQTPSYGGELVVVGSFRSKSWTTIAFPYMVSSVISGPIVNGNLHWFASKNDSGSHFLQPHQIIYFDAHIDKFVEVPMPEPRGEDGDIICGLGVLDGCLCMSRSDRPGNSESNVEVLIMKEYGVKNSWTIMFVVSDGFTCNHLLSLVPLGYTMNGSVLTKVFLQKDLDWHIRAFNFAASSDRRISIPKVKDHYLDVIEYEESLITPTDYGWEEEELKGEATYVEDSRKMMKGRDGYWMTEMIVNNRLVRY